MPSSERQVEQRAHNAHTISSSFELKDLDLISALLFGP